MRLPANGRMITAIEEHYRYLSDVARMDAYRRAIEQVVKPGDSVLDLGAGTGVLGLMACRAGARRVYAVEQAEIIDLAREICRANGFEDRVTFVRERSTATDLPEKVNVVVTEQIGRFGIEVGDLVECLEDARQRLLEPGGRMIPAQVDLYVAPVECQEAFEKVGFWENPGGLDLRPARVLAENTIHPFRFEAGHIVGDPFEVASLDFSSPILHLYRARGRVRAARDGLLHGLAGWFSARLAPGVRLSNSPLAPDSMRRNNIFLPLAQPVSLTQGDPMRIAVSVAPSSAMINWQVEVLSGRGGAVRKALFQHSTFKGLCLSAADLKRTRPKAVPSLRPRSQALSSVLAMCDGQRTVADIEKEVLRLYPGLFRSPLEAERFVADAIQRHAE